MATYKLTPDGNLENITGVIESEDCFYIDTDGYIHCSSYNENQSLPGNIKMKITVDYVLSLTGTSGSGPSPPGSAWATTTNMVFPKGSGAGCGNVNDALTFGGVSPTNENEIWDGSTWATTSALNDAKRAQSSCGDVSNALCMGGYTGGYIKQTEIWS